MLKYLFQGDTGNLLVFEMIGLTHLILILIHMLNRLLSKSNWSNGLMFGLSFFDYLEYLNSKWSCENALTHRLV